MTAAHFLSKPVKSKIFGMSLQLVAFIALGVALIALCAVVLVAWKMTEIASHHVDITRLQQLTEQNADDVADVRDKMRHWMKRWDMRAAREAQSDSPKVDLNAVPTSDREVKNRLRVLAQQQAGG